MTSTGKPGTAPLISAREHDVIEFLRANPAFLDKHPELLRLLTIPHASGDAVSLLERQIAVLREDNARLKKQLDELLRFARQNQELNRKIQALVLSLMNAVGPQAIFANLERSLSEEFGADRVQSFIFAEPAFVDGGELAQFVGPTGAARAAFAGAIAAATTVCGVLPEAQRSAVFGKLEHAGSAVVMPLLGQGWDGVLVIASNDATRYQADMGTEFLTYLKEIVTLVLDPWIKRARPA